MDRGLGQRGLLSPLLFLIAAKGFSILMNEVEDVGLYLVFRFEMGVERFIHLQYTHDTMNLDDK